MAKVVAGAAALATASWSGYVKYLEYSDFKKKRILNPQGRLFFISRLALDLATLQSRALKSVHAFGSINDQIMDSLETGDLLLYQLPWHAKGPVGLISPV